MGTERTAERSASEQTRIGFDLETMTGAQWLAALLATITGVIHLYLYYMQGFIPFLFAGVVFLGAVVALMFHVYPRVLYLLGIPFTAGQIALWYLQGMPDMEIAMIDKPVQALLVVVLLYLFVTSDEPLPFIGR